MAGGDLRLNNRKLKVKALPQNLPDFVELILRHLTWVTNYMLLKFLHQLQNHAPRQHSNLSSEDFSCSYESSSRSSKSSKAPVKGKKK
jgi:large subunit ribosomal protein L25